MKTDLETIRGVIDRVLWTAGASGQNRQLLAEAIDEELRASQELPPNQAVETTGQFLALARSGSFAGSVIVDNDSVTAYGETDEPVFEFHGDGPEGALVGVLNALGIEASRL